MALFRRVPGFAICTALTAAASLPLAPPARAVCNSACNEVACSASIGPLATSDPIAQMLDEVSRRTISTKSNRGPSLFLSGGGSYGAWGAGVLYGRQLMNGNPHEFDLVTGVSTGALMATLAFIGDYDGLKNVYTNAKEKDIQTTNWRTMFWRSMFSREPLRKLSECTLNNHLGGKTRFELVKEQADAGRVLLVGTVDLDTGKLCAWDMTCIACRGDETRYMDVVMASANAPAIGPPVAIDGGYHVDGGARAQVLARGIANSAFLGKDAYFLVNGKLEGGIGEMDEGWEDGFYPIVSIASRGLEIFEHEALTLVLHYYQKHFAANRKITYLSRTPDAVPVDFKKREFPRDKMAALFREGCRWGRNMNPWPRWDRLDMPPHPNPYPPTSWPDTPIECAVAVEPPKRLCTPDGDGG